MASTDPVFALIDCNAFYCSCERVWRPDLARTPIVVLSNNDGCVISRTTEAKALGIKMGQPYFQIRDDLRRWGVAAFSSNYALYGDMSERVMCTLEGMVPRLEIYSIDKNKLHTVDAQSLIGHPWTLTLVLTEISLGYR